MLGSWEPGNGPGDGHKAQNMCTRPVSKKNKIPTKLLSDHYFSLIGALCMQCFP